MGNGKYEIKLGDYVTLNERGITEIFNDNINTALYGIVISINDNIIAYKDLDTGMTKTCSAYWLKKGAPNDEFWYAIAASYNKMKGKSQFAKDIEKYPNLIDFYNSIEEQYLNNHEVEQAIQQTYYKKLEKYINKTEQESNNNENENISVGDNVILNDEALENSLITNLGRPLWGEVIDITPGKNGNSIITYIEPETLEINMFNASSLEKGTPNKEFVYKILGKVKGLVASKDPSSKEQYENIRKNRWLQFNQLLKLQKKYLPSEADLKEQAINNAKVRAEVEQRENLINSFFKTKLVEYYKDELLDTKVREAKELLRLLYEFTNNEYKDSDILLLCNHVANAYSFENKDNKSLTSNQKFTYALAEEYAYNRIIENSSNDNLQDLYNEFIKLTPINLDVEIVKSAIDISIEKFKHLNYQNNKVL